MVVDVSGGETYKEKIELVYLALYRQYENLVDHGADIETFSLMASGDIAESLGNCHRSGYAKWDYGVTYIGNLNMRWRLYINTEQPVNILCTFCNIGYQELEIENFPHTENWHRDSVKSQIDSLPMASRYMPRADVQVRTFLGIPPVVCKKPFRLKYDPKEGF